MVDAEDILGFWFSDHARKRWFDSTPEFDALIKHRFERTAQTVAAGPFPNTEWEGDARSALALIIALDQFPRNMFRGSAKAFAWDSIALGVADRLIDRDGDLSLSDEERKFAYVPFMHAENLAAQNRCVELTGSRLNDGGETLGFAKDHRDVIERFGRFPHRNAVLGRQSTPEEQAFLENGGYDPS
jgi:uncharacterized protein (DUF924 family)